MTSDTELRIEMAKCLGWSVVHSSIHSEFATKDSAIWHLRDDCISDLPNWPQDLNACAEFEAQLKHGEAREYYFLATLANTRKIVTATARQRCIARLRMEGVKCE